MHKAESHWKDKTKTSLFLYAGEVSANRPLPMFPCPSGLKSGSQIWMGIFANPFSCTEFIKYRLLLTIVNTHDMYIYIYIICFLIFF